MDFHDRRKDDRDFVGGSGPFYLTTHGNAEESRWNGMPPTRAAKREVGGYYRGQKQTQTWREANRLASRRTRRSSGPFENTANYAAAYHDNLVRVLASKGPKLAKQFGEIPPGR